MLHQQVSHIQCEVNNVAQVNSKSYRVGLSISLDPEAAGGLLLDSPVKISQKAKSNSSIFQAPTFQVFQDISNLAD